MTRALALLAVVAGAARADCPPRGDAIVVDGAARTLTLCHGGAAVARHGVALGRAGLGKAAEGDDRTPTGTYPLGAPRRSGDYRMFVPIGYPTPAQARAGATGGSIGIHGPPRALARLPGGALAAGAVDWTRGCVAVTTDAAIDAIAAWVRRHPRATVTIE